MMIWNELWSSPWFWTAVYLTLGWGITEVVVRWGGRELSLSSIVFITLSWPILVPCAVIMTALKRRAKDEE